MLLNASTGEWPTPCDGLVGGPGADAVPDGGDEGGAGRGEQLPEGPVLRQERRAHRLRGRPGG